MFWRKKKDPAEELEATLQKAVQTLGNALPDIDKLSPQEQAEFKALVAAAGIAGSSLRAAQIIKKADDFGDRMHDQTMKMIEDAHAMTMAKPDPQQMIDSCNRIIGQLEAAKNKTTADAKAVVDDANWIKNGCPATEDIKISKPLKLKHRAGARP